MVCCDGTWDTPADRTNVSLVADALAEGPDQVVRYFGGVGTGTDPVTRLLQGGLGLGLNTRVREAYTWLAQTWRPGDEIVLLGFSRGAYTVRSLAGMLADAGSTRSPDDSRWRRPRLVRRVSRDGYQRGRPLHGVRTAPGFGPDDTAPIRFLGVRTPSAPWGSRARSACSRAGHDDSRASTTSGWPPTCVTPGRPSRSTSAAARSSPRCGRPQSPAPTSRSSSCGSPGPTATSAVPRTGRAICRTSRCAG